MDGGGALDATGAAAEDAAVERLVSLLRELGATDGEIADARAAGRLRSLAVQLMVAPENRMTAAEVAERAGATVDDVLRLWRAWGLPPPAPDDRRFGEADVPIVQFALLVETIVGRDVAYHTSRVMGMAIARIAEAEISMIRSTLEVPLAAEGVPLPDIVIGYRDVIETMLQPARDSIHVLHDHCLVETARRHDVHHVEASPVNRTDAVIGFADLTGSTRLTVELALDELDRALSEFEQRTSDLIADGGATLVKRIGDAVMYTAPSVDVGVGVSLDLVDAFDHDPLVPPVRVGLAAGTVVALRGDYYGLAVNKAARLLHVAQPSSVLAGDEIIEHLEGDGRYCTEHAGLHQLAGFPEPVAAHAVRRG